MQLHRIGICLFFSLCLIVQPVVTDARRHKGDSSVSVELERPKFDVRVFDPAHKPDPCPPIPPGLHAVTPYNFSCYQESWLVNVGEYTDAGGSIHVQQKPESLRIKVGLTATTWLPNDAQNKLKEHEAGHIDIYRTVYEQRAEEAAKTAGDAVLGQVIEGSGPDIATARRDVQHKVTLGICSRFHQLTRDVASKVDTIYDAMTDHGRNNVSTASAVKQALNQADDPQR